MPTEMNNQAAQTIATSKTHDRCTDPENCKRCSEDASTPHAGIPHVAPAASGVHTSTNEAWASRAQEKIAAMDAAASVSERNPGAEGAMHWIDRYAAGIDEVCQLDRVEQALTQQRGASVREGWRLVPIEPNWDMRNEGREFLIDGLEKEPEKLAYFLWKTMVAAAPEVK